MAAISEYDSSSSESDAGQDAATARYAGQFLEGSWNRKVSKSMLLVLLMKETPDTKKLNAKDLFEHCKEERKEVLIALTYKNSRMYKELRDDIYFPNKFRMFEKEFKPKIGSVLNKEWVAEVALSFLLVCNLFNQEGANFELLIPHELASIICSSLLLSLEEVIPKVLPQLQALFDSKLFCLDPCKHDCEFKTYQWHTYVSNLREVKLTPMPRGQNMQRWRLKENTSLESTHPLYKVFCMQQRIPNPTASAILPILKAVTDAFPKRKYTVYVLLVVNYKRKLSKYELYERRREKGLVVSLYAGLTKEEGHRSSHFWASRDNKSAVYKSLIKTSSVFRIFSEEYETLERAAQVEATFIQICKMKQDIWDRKNSRDLFIFLNKRTEYDPLVWDDVGLKENALEFHKDEFQLFRFIDPNDPRKEYAQCNGLIKGNFMVRTEIPLNHNLIKLVPKYDDMY